MATDFVERFKRYLQEDGKSAKTIESYTGDIAGFVDVRKYRGINLLELRE